MLKTKVGSTVRTFEPGPPSPVESIDHLCLKEETGSLFVYLSRVPLPRYVGLNLSLEWSQKEDCRKDEEGRGSREKNGNKEPVRVTHSFLTKKIIGGPLRRKSLFPDSQDIFRSSREIENGHVWCRGPGRVDGRDGWTDEWKGRKMGGTNVVRVLPGLEESEHPGPTL